MENINTTSVNSAEQIHKLIQN